MSASDSRLRGLRLGPIAFEPHLLRVHGRTPAPARTAAGAIDVLIREESSRIVANWVVQVANLPAFRAMPEVGLLALRSTAPGMLHETLLLVAAEDAGADLAGQGRGASLAWQHGAERAASGMAIDVLLAEYHLLHREVWSALWRMIDSDPAYRQPMRMLQPRLDAAFDRLAAAAAAAWVAQAVSR